MTEKNPTIARPDLIADLRTTIAEQADEIVALRALADSRAADVIVSQEIARRALDQLAARQPDTTGTTTTTKTTGLYVIKAA